MNYLSLGIVFAIFIIVAFILMVIHNFLLMFIWYRWLINSIIFPYTKYRLKRKIKRSTADEINIMYLNLDMAKRWFDNYWFAKRIKKIISDKVETVNVNLN